MKESGSSKVAFIRLIFGGGTVSSDGSNVAVKCPVTSCPSRSAGKQKYSISVLTDRSHCWVCGFKTGRTLLRALREAGASPAQVREYVEKYLVESSGHRLSSLQEFEGGSDLCFPGDFILLAQHTASRDPDVRQALKYLRSRGLSEGDLWRHRIGISRERRFFRRVIFPSFDSSGDLNFYTARTIDSDGFPKYVNPDVDKLPVIFNELNVDWSREVTLVEGPFDLVKCDENATCLLGSSLTEDYLLFWRIVQNRTPVVLGLDSDAVVKADRYASLLTSYSVPVRILELGSAKDVGEMDKSTFMSAKSASRAWNSVTALRNRINHMSVRPVSGKSRGALT